MDKNYYKILGLQNFAAPAEVKLAFKQMALLHHPDRNPGNAEAEEKFKLVNEAYQLLSDHTSKTLYDEMLLRGSTQIPRYQPVYRPKTSHFRKTTGQKKVAEKSKSSNGGTSFFSILIVLYMFFIFNSARTFYARYHYSEGLELHKDGQSKAAADALNIAANADPSYTRAHYLAGIINLNYLNNAGRAVENFHNCVRTAEVFRPEYRLNRGLAMAEMRMPAAVSDLDTSLIFYGDSSLILSRIADLYYEKLKEYDRAESIWAEMEKRQMTDSRVLYRRALISKQSDDFDQAIVFLRRACEEEPENHKFWYQKALTELDAGRPDSVCVSWAETRRLNPEIRDAVLEFYCK